MTESGLKLMSWLVGAALVTAMLAIPQAVDPWEMPSLVLDRAAVADAIRFDRALAQEAPETEDARTLRSLFLDHGRAEANPPYSTRDYDRRQAQIHHATQALVASAGPPAFDAMRARAVESLMALLESDADPEDETAQGILGGFREIQTRYGLVEGDVRVAPELTIRALYKARWNAIHRQPLVEGFSAAERQAYWGWLALHGWGQPLDRREEALVAFRQAGGRNVDEAAALFDLLAGNHERAAASLQSLYSKTGELRLRNTALGALHGALSQSRASR